MTAIHERASVARPGHRPRANPDGPGAEPTSVATAVQPVPGRGRPTAPTEGVTRSLGRWSSGRYAAARRMMLEHALITDTVLALLVGVVSAPWLETTDPSLHSWLLQAALLVPLAWRRRYPRAVFAVTCAVALLQWFVGVELVADLSLLVALSTVATYRTRWWGLAAAGLLEVGAVMASVRWSLAGSWPRSLVFLSGIIAAGLLLGTNLRARRALVDGLTLRAERLERERDQQALLAAAAERTRIAREMHDVIGHSLAVMVSLADGARAKIDADPARAASAIANVSELGRQALGETRRLLGVLRADDTDGLAPQPGLARLADLAARTRETGLTVELDCRGDLTGLSAGAELAVYRIVQEAITNTVRHAAAPTTIAITVAATAAGITVDVTDDGRMPARPGAPDDGGRGHGLVGMRERAALYGGTVTAGPVATVTRAPVTHADPTAPGRPASGAVRTDPAGRGPATDARGWAVHARLRTAGP